VTIGEGTRLRTIVAALLGVPSDASAQVPDDARVRVWQRHIPLRLCKFGFRFCSIILLLPQPGVQDHPLLLWRLPHTTPRYPPLPHLAAWWRRCRTPCALTAAWAPAAVPNLEQPRFTTPNLASANMCGAGAISNDYNRKRTAGSLACWCKESNQGRCQNAWLDRFASVDSVELTAPAAVIHYCHLLLSSITAICCCHLLLPSITAVYVTAIY
jgi:hypothetical protein